MLDRGKDQDSYNRAVMRRRIYTDTSVIGGCLDDEFEEFSGLLIQRFISGSSTLVLSDLTRLELSRAPEAVRAVLDGIPSAIMEEVRFTEEAAQLSQAYIDAKVIGEAMRFDAQHIATATIHRVDVLVSWNFKHIVNLERIQGYNSINLRLGYPLLEIRTPREVLSYEDQD
jgi:hypothetical protein